MKNNHLNKTILFSIWVLFLPSILCSQNYVTTLAGNGIAGFVNGDTSVAQFNKPFGICIDPEGNVYLADAYNHRIRKIGIDGQVSTYAGTGIAGYLDGPADEARFNQPLNICFDDEGNMFVSDFLNQRIRKISADMQVTTIAGNGQAGYQEGPANQAMFNYPRGICLDDTGNIYIGDSWNHRIRKISTDGIVSTWAGGGSVMGVQSIGSHVDANDTSARFYTPCELSIDQYNNIFVADAYNHMIRKIDPVRMVTTVAGSGDPGPNGGGFQNGLASEAMFKVPTACFVSLTGTIYVGDGENQRIRKISTDGLVSTFAGSGFAGFDNGPDSIATFNFPRGCVMDIDTHRIYVVDFNNHAVRIIQLSAITGSNEFNNNLNLEIFPNPASKEISISGTEAISGMSVQIFGTSGQLIKEIKGVAELPLNINILDFDPGIYYVSLVNNKGSYRVEKLIVLR
ncbi:MAG: T9SS type A sorting domain-containing protein [Bacteroidales bacterium]